MKNWKLFEGNPQDWYFYYLMQKFRTMETGQMLHVNNIHSFLLFTPKSILKEYIFLNQEGEVSNPPLFSKHINL